MPATDKWSESLKRDMAHIRTRAVGLALAQSPELARDYAKYTLLRQICDPYGRFNSTGLDIRAEVGSRGPEAPEGSLKLIEKAFEALHETMTLDWLSLPAVEGFAAFRALPQEARDAFLALAVAQTLKPRAGGAARNTDMREVVEAEALPNIRDVWTPDASYFARLTKPALLEILKEDLGVSIQAEAYAKSKKSELVTYLDQLFAAPLVTLTEDQRAAVVAWAPVPMQTPVSLGLVEDEEAQGADDIGDGEASVTCEAGTEPAA
jgi:ParB family chromosome partitioning protein